MKSILLLFVVFLLIFPVSKPPSHGENKEIKHAVIRINSDADFTFQNGVVAGCGTRDDPYIISGWKIDATNRGDGIFISNTRAYFIIRNCVIYNSSGNSLPYFGWAGIHLSNVWNGVIEGNLCKGGSWYGISLYRSSHIIVRGNTVSENKYAGIYIYNSSSSMVIENDVVENRYGIFISFKSENNGIRGNRIVENEDYGVAIWDESCSNNTVYGNYFVHNNHSTDKYDRRHIQAIDNGLNRWDYNFTGNYWSDWNYRKPYRIDGNSGSMDHHPMVEYENNPVPTIIISLILIVFIILVFWVSRRR